MKSPMGLTPRYAAFTDRPEGGNPAEVVLDAGGMSEAETLGVRPSSATRRPPSWPSGRRRASTTSLLLPLAEVPFCGHATIAGGVALADARGVTGQVTEPGGMV